MCWTVKAFGGANVILNFTDIKIVAQRDDVACQGGMLVAGK